MLHLIFSILIILLILAGVSFFNILWHETGHAIPMLLCTKGDVTIFIGSLGDSSRSLHFRLGRLKLCCKYNPLLWMRGLCRTTEVASINKRILYIATGPIASLILTLGCWYLTSMFEFSDWYKFAVGSLLWISLISTFTSIFPRSNTFFNNKGQPTHNDASQILLLLKEKRLPPDYKKALAHYKLKEFKEAAVLLDGLIDMGVKSSSVCRVAVLVHLQRKNYGRAAAVTEIIRKSFSFNADDCVNEGVIYNRAHEPEKAVACYKRALYINPKHIYAMNNIGYSMILLGDADNSIYHFDKAIKMSPNFSYPYSNRGWAYTIMGRTEKGLIDLNHALSLDDSNGEVYRNLGFYYMQKGDLAKAQELLEKAKEMEEDMPLIDEYLTKLKNIAGK